MSIRLGITVVVSPLISLVEDQIYALRKLHVDARSLNTSTPRDEQTEIMRILDGKNSDGSDMKILYLTPGWIFLKEKFVIERLRNIFSRKNR